MTEDPEPPDVFAMLNDEYARDILVATKRERLSAKALCEECGMSRSTVSRRVNSLVEQGFLEEHTHIDSNGHHYNEYEAQLDRIEVLLRESGFVLTIERRPDPADRLTRVFEEMRSN